LKWSAELNPNKSSS